VVKNLYNKLVVKPLDDERAHPPPQRSAPLLRVPIV
jgi:hypothetical protein